MLVGSARWSSRTCCRGLHPQGEPVLADALLPLWSSGSDRRCVSCFSFSTRWAQGDQRCRHRCADQPFPKSCSGRVRMSLWPCEDEGLFTLSGKMNAGQNDATCTRRRGLDAEPAVPILPGAMSVTHKHGAGRAQVQKVCSWMMECTGWIP